MTLQPLLTTAQIVAQSAPADGAADWVSAVSTGITAIVAIIALVLAGKQLGEATQARRQTKELELEKSQPYVVVTMEELDGNPTILHLVIRNYGQTLARNVRVRIEPEPQSSTGGQGVERVQYPSVIPALAPGQEWRTVWDFGRERAETDLPDFHSGEVTYTGINSAELSTEIILDWSIYKSRHWIERRGIHEVAEALREMSKTHQKWSESLHGGLAVYTRSGKERDERLAAQARAWKERRDGQPERAPQEQLEPKEDAPPTEG